MNLSLPASKFSAIFSAMLFAASREGDEMPSMCGVRVERFDSVLTIVATDGKWLLRWREIEGQTDENGEVVDRVPFAVTIPRRVLESFLAAMKKPLALERVNLDVSGSPCTLSTILDIRSHEFMRQPEQFPPVDKVIPTRVSPTVSAITLSSGLFASVARAWHRAGGGSMFLQMAGDEVSPVVITSPSTPELLAVVMPLRPGDANALDEVPVADAGMAAPDRDDLTREMFPDDRGPDLSAEVKRAARALRDVVDNAGATMTISANGGKPVTIGKRSARVKDSTKGSER